MAKLEFPKNFYWGAATASHQVEGNTENDWSEWEKTNAERLARASQHTFRHNPHWKKFEREATDPKNYLSGRACEHYTRYAQDFDILQTLHLNAYRFSIEWSRVEPKEGVFDEQAIAHYQSLIADLRKRNIEPFITLWHWTLPLWLAERGGTISDDFPRYFERYATKISETLGSEVTFWITLNEPDVVSAHAYLKGAWPPQKKNIFSYYTALKNLIAAHKRTYHTIKKQFPTAQIGIAKHQIAFEMARPTFVNHLLKALADFSWNTYFLRRIRNHQDFIGLNHYKRNVIDNGFGKNPNNIQTDFGWEYWPQSIYQALMELKPYRKPIYITESGIADASDLLRQQFIPAVLSAVHHAIQDGADVKGYFYWSLLDNFEWDKGYWLRFGLVHIDYPTQKRTIRPSALAYTEICKTNTLET